MKFKKINNRWRFTIIAVAFIAIIGLLPTSKQTPVQYIERSNGALKTEKAPGEKWLYWLYQNPLGEATLWALVKRKAVSSMYGKMMDRPSSVKKVAPFVQDYNVDLNLAQKQDFESFNDFFTRKLIKSARPMNSDSLVAVSPSDGKVLAYQNLGNQDFIIKGYRFDVSTFLNDSLLAKNYKNGTLIIVRLAPPDYHRYHFPVSGNIIRSTNIDGKYYSVNPIALREKAEIFLLNKRQYSLISNPLFGVVIMAEVGATMVGSMVQTYTGNFAEKGKEKGYFKFGGSTVVLLFEPSKIRVDADILENTAKGLETSVKMGERIGASTRTEKSVMPD